MFLIELTYTRPLAEVDNLLGEHSQFLKKYYDEGIFLLSGRKHPRTGGIILARAESMADIEKIISEDPFHRHGLAEYTITEFLPSMANETLKAFL